MEHNTHLLWSTNIDTTRITNYVYRGGGGCLGSTPVIQYAWMSDYLTCISPTCKQLGWLAFRVLVGGWGVGWLLVRMFDPFTYPGMVIAALRTCVRHRARWG